MFLNLAIIFSFLFFTAYFVHKFVKNDFYGIKPAEAEKEKSEKLFSIIEQIVSRLDQKNREFAIKNGEDFALQYFDLKVKSIVKEKPAEKRVKEFYLFSAIKLEGELIFLLNFLKKNKKLLDLMKGIKVPEEYLKEAEKWEKECEAYFSFQ